MTSTTYATSAKLGSVTLTGKFLPKLACDTPIAIPTPSINSSWRRSSHIDPSNTAYSDWTFERGWKYTVAAGQQAIGEQVLVWFTADPPVPVACNVIDATDDQVKIHYIGYHNMYDEWLPRTSNRIMRLGGQVPIAGQVRLSFKTNSWAESETLYTVLGLNNAETMADWMAPSSWLCSGSPLSDVRPGKFTKDELFKKLASENTGVTWACRIVGFILLWLSCMCLLGPLNVAADMVPYVGPYIGNVVEKIICCITFPPAACLCIGICSIVWVAMRPAAGTVLLLAFLCASGCFIVSGWKAHDSRMQEKEEVRGSSQMIMDTE